jgi:hypothetical protein
MAHNEVCEAPAHEARFNSLRTASMQSAKQNGMIEARPEQASRLTEGAQEHDGTSARFEASLAKHHHDTTSHTRLFGGRVRGKGRAAHRRRTEASQPPRRGLSHRQTCLSCLGFHLQDTPWVELLQKAPRKSPAAIRQVSGAPTWKCHCSVFTHTQKEWSWCAWPAERMIPRC